MNMLGGIFLTHKKKPLFQGVTTLSQKFMANSLCGEEERGEIVFTERFKRTSIRMGRWTGHFVLSCSLVLEILFSRVA